MLWSTGSRQKEYPYTELPSPDSELLEHEPTFVHKGTSKSRSAALVICLLCTLINVALNVLPLGSDSNMYPSRTTFPSSKGLSTRREIDTLRRPSQSIGLQSIHRNKTASRATTIYPYILSPINENDPTVVYGNDPKGYLHPLVGTISPEDRQMRASNTFSTVAQFRVMDFGMEICELQIRIPANQSTDEESFEIASQGLVIYRLDQATSLYADTLSYASRPSRLEKFADVRLDYGMEWTHRFACTMDEILTFEVACPISAKPGECEVNWWQNREKPNPAIFLVQYPSR
ncbi:hypothetical protein K435DRAFT_788864 [Dendrothele bispora CBS 962.96]|uniref:Ubiquitin 3 binding protein But2 C-terminal domain-containing protein n=1 Tax=Dendrothele bispora (strain CBS 962.96) TaxID=1314807 RepID=A0A4S8MUY1_DENBC|nr:hypothetical protein K435DRAFT_788864 [Dendrothele bispora CBS 962.96]